MPGYTGIIDRTGAESLIPPEVSTDVLNNLLETNWLLRTARRLRNMTRAEFRMPALAAMAVAGFVSGDIGLKPVSELSWEDKYINAEEIAVIVPVAENVIADADYDIWGQIRPEIERAFGKVINGAVLYGTDIPATWDTNMGGAGLVEIAAGASQDVSIDDFDDFYGAVEGETTDGAANGVLALLEADGFIATRHVACAGVKSRMRNCRDANGQKIYPNTNEIDGAPIDFPLDGSMDATQALMISGDWSQLVYAIRQDITYKYLDQAVINDAAGKIVLNMPQQDCVGIRAVMRLGFALPNPINQMNEVDATRCPFATLAA